MNNLFIVNTTFQMLTAYILANTVAKGDRNHLFLVNGGFKAWKDSQCLSFMSSDTETWSRITTYHSWLKTSDKFSNFGQSISEAKAAILSDGKVDQVYLCSDKIIQNQFLVEVSGNNSYIRFDEGFGSYFARDRRWGSKIWQYLRVQLFRQLGGINQRMTYNFGGLGHGMAATVDYFYRPELLQRYSPKEMRIEKKQVYHALSKLASHISRYTELEVKGTILFIGSTFVEQGMCKFRDEVNALNKTLEFANKNKMALLYKPHPSEDLQKVDKYLQQIPGMRLFQPLDPIEVILYAHNKLSVVISYGSSGLLYCDIFAEHNIVPISLIKLYKSTTYQESLIVAFKKVGVLIPDSYTELDSIIGKLG